MRYLITGASGFLGSHLLRECVDQGVEATGIQSGRRVTGLVTCDLSCQSLVGVVGSAFFETASVVVVHCAFVRQMEHCSSAESRRVNVDATIELMRQLQSFQVQQIYVSTSYVFDGQRGGYRETDVPAPLSEYGQQKRMVEQFVESEIRDALIVRLDKLIGDNSCEEHLLTEWWARIRNRQPIRCLRGQRFSPTLVRDAAQAILTAGRRGLTGLYHVANPTSIARKELAELFVRQSSAKTAIQEVSQQELGLEQPRPRDSSLDVSLFTAATGFQFTPHETVIEQFFRSAIA